MFLAVSIILYAMICSASWSIEMWTGPSLARGDGGVS